MQLVAHTAALYGTARRRIDYIETLLPTKMVGFDRALDRDVAFVTVELLNTWARFSRTLYFSVCRGVRDSAGSRVLTSMDLRDFDAAQRFASQRFRNHPLPAGPLNHRHEPNWLDPNILQTLLNDIGATNSATVNSALSVSTRVFQDLPSIRNFYGHRGADTARKAKNVARNYMTSPSLHPTELCLTFAPGRAQSILRDWVYDLRSIMRLAVA